MLCVGVDGKLSFVFGIRPFLRGLCNIRKYLVANAIPDSTSTDRSSQGGLGLFVEE